MTTFWQEQRVFRRLQTDSTEQIKQEYEKAISTLVERYNTTIYENRFTVGGAVEVFTYALLRSVGIDCALYGNQAKSGDILLPNDRKLSVKSSFTGGPADIRLLNKQGGGARKWDVATLFVLSEVGIVFGAPDMVSEEWIQDVSDAVVLKRKAIAALIKNPSNVIQIKIIKKPPTEMTGLSHKASNALAKQIIFEEKLENLLAAISKD